MMECNFCEKKVINSEITKFVVPSSMVINTTEAYYLCSYCTLEVMSWFKFKCRKGQLNERRANERERTSCMV